MKKYLYAACIPVFMFSCISNTQDKPAVRKLPYYNTPDFTPHFDNTVPDSFHKIRPFTLTAHTGQPFTEKNMNGKICIANFFFTSCPGICPRMTTNLKILQDSFPNDKNIQIISHTVMPYKDDVTTLKKFARARNVDAQRWVLLTGRRAEIYDLGRRFYFVEEDAGEKRDTTVFLHTENFVLTDKHRHIRGIYNGLSISSIQNLINDIRELERE